MEQQMSAFVAGTCLIMSLPAALCVLCVHECVRACVCACVPVCVLIASALFECMHHIKVYLRCVLQADSSHMIICQGVIVLRMFLLRGWYENISSVRCHICNFSHINLYQSSWWLVYTADLWKSTDICSCNVQFVAVFFFMKKKKSGLNLMTGNIDQ